MMTRHIPLTRGYVAIVDDADFERVAAKKWATAICRTNVYAQHYWREGKCVRAIGLARFILDAPDDLIVDHINGNALDNRRCNLRLCTHAENMRNRRPHKRRDDMPDLPKGVYKRANRYFASITVERRRHYLGTFATPEAAALAYDAAAINLHGEYARLNVPANDVPSRQREDAA